MMDFPESLNSGVKSSLVVGVRVGRKGSRSRRLGRSIGTQGVLLGEFELQS